MSREQNRRAGQKKLPAKKSNQTWVFVLMLLVGAAAVTILFLPPEALQSKKPQPRPEAPAESGSRAASAPSSSAPPSGNPGMGLAQLPTNNLATLSDAEKAAYYQNAGSQLLEQGRFADAISQYPNGC